ncbi:MAG: aspartate--tRNA(Asn) ligase [bacterium]|nr:aspartate--tRNA(Asn) ligase [bacterium]
MKRILVSETLKNIGNEVLLKGWVRTRRDHGKLIFLDLRDRSGVVQLIINPQVSPKAHQIAREIRPEYAVSVTGKVNKRPDSMINPELETGTVEVEVQKLEILSRAEELPFDLGGPALNLNLETLLDHRSLSLRHPKIAAIFKVQETIVQSFREILKNFDFTEIQVPTIVASTTEGGAEVFRIKYYDHDAYLAQSPQLYKQILVSAFERVFTLAHVYRAEPSITTRHISEYLSLDVELSFIDSWEELMDLAENVVASMIQNIRKNNQQELNLFGVQVPEIKNAIPRIKMREAQEIIFKRTGRDHQGEPDLDPSDEKELCGWAKENSGAPFVFITHYPTKKRPFYTYPNPSDSEYTLSFDLLGINEEWITGGQRINNYQELLENIKKRGNEPEDFTTYLEAFRYGMPPEGGFAIGLERVTKDILGLKNIREASLFPRDMERVDQRFSQMKTQKQEKKLP